MWATVLPWLGTLLFGGGLLAVVVLLARKGGGDAAELKAAEKNVDVAKKMADAETAGPHDQSAVVDRLRDGSF